MSLTRLVAVATLWCVAACSAELATPIPDRDGTLAGSSPSPGTSSGPAPDAGATTPSPAPASDSGTGGAIWGDAGSAPVTEAGGPVQDSGSGYVIDAGTGTPAAPGTGALGSCGNPACATDGNQCGCQATDSTGNIVQMGCQAGGECICLENQQTTGQPFDENGACSSQSSTTSQFIANCTCQ